MPNIFRTGRPTNIKLGTQTEHKDPHQRQALWPPRPKVKVARSRYASVRNWPISREWNVPETQKMVEGLFTLLRTSFKVKGQRSRSSGRLNVETVSASYLRTERPTNFKLSVPMKDEDPYRRDEPSPASQRLISRCHVVRLTGPVLAHKSRTKSLRNIKISNYWCHEQ